MGINRPKQSVSALKQITSYLFPVWELIENKPGTNEKKCRYDLFPFIPVYSLFIPCVRINNKYIIINNLYGLFPKYSRHYPLFIEKKSKRGKKEALKIQYLAFKKLHNIWVGPLTMCQMSIWGKFTFYVMFCHVYQSLQNLTY